MGCCDACLQKVFGSSDPDDILAYQTLKVAIIHDRKLGALHYGFQFTIFCYIVFHNLVYEKGYMLTQVPGGSVRTTILPPQGAAERFTVDALPYCCDVPGTCDVEVPGQIGAQYDCKYFDENFLSWPWIDRDASFITTRVRQEEQVNDLDGCDPLTIGTPSCFDFTISDETTYFAAQPEDFTIFIDHAMTAPSLGFMLNSDNSEGLMQPVGIRGQDGELLDPCDDYTSRNLACPPVVRIDAGTRDIIPLRTLLRAAGIDDLTTGGDVVSTTSGGMQSFRYAGLVLQVNIDYTNLKGGIFDSGKVFSYTYTVNHIAEASFKGEEVATSTADGTARTIFNRHGVRLVFEQRGEVGRFDFTTLLVELVAGLALIKIAVTLVDFVMMSLLHNKERYKALKVDHSEDFSDLDAGNPSSQSRGPSDAASLVQANGVATWK